MLRLKNLSLIPSTLNKLKLSLYSKQSKMGDTKDASYWKQKLAPQQFNVCRLGATEPAFANKYWNHHEKGKYTCVCCHQELFDSTTKFDSRTGWPSFNDVIQKGHVKTLVDNSFGMSRTEVRCNNCDAHLGHLFEDDTQPTQKRYCINSASLDFQH